MAVFEPISASRKAEMLSHLLGLARSRLRDTAAPQSDPHSSFIPDLISNVRRFDYVPSPRQLHALSQNLSLTIGGAFKLFGYSLEGMRHLDFLLNGTRTRFIEAHPFYRDRRVSVPEALGNPSTFDQTSVLSDAVRSWREGVPIRAIHGPNWRRLRLLYAQIGTNDGLALPTIPPGAIVAIREVSETERREPNPESFYFMQHRAGYFCCRCLVANQRLHLITRGEKVGAQMDFAYPGDVRIVGRIMFFAARLPVLNPQPAASSPGRAETPLVLPWEHSSFPSLLATERRRFGITNAQIVMNAQILAAELGTVLSARTMSRHERNEGIPRAAALLAMISILSLRVSDVLRVLGLWSSEQQKFSLTTLMESEKGAQHLSSAEPPPSPEPHVRWHELLDRWGEWPTLLSITHPNLLSHSDELLLFNPGGFKVLEPLIRRHSIFALDSDAVFPPNNGAVEKDEWARPIFAVRHRGEILCGYLEADETHFAIQPHPQSGVPRLTFRRNQIQVLGRMTGVATPLQPAF